MGFFGSIKFEIHQIKGFQALKGTMASGNELNAKPMKPRSPKKSRLEKGRERYEYFFYDFGACCLSTFC